MSRNLKKYAMAAIAALVLAYAGHATAVAATNQIKVQSETTTTGSTSTTSTTATTTKKVFKSYYCNHKINQYDAATWACTTITVNPATIEAGDKTTVTFRYKVKIGLKNVKVCFSGLFNVTGLRCLYQHKFRRLRQWRVIKHTLPLEVPADFSYYGEQDVDNLTRFYKKGQKWADLKTFYWRANAAVCVTTASHPDAC